MRKRLFWDWSYQGRCAAPMLSLGFFHVWWFADDPWHTLHWGWNVD